MNGRTVAQIALLALCLSSLHASPQAGHISIPDCDKQLENSGALDKHDAIGATPRAEDRALHYRLATIKFRPSNLSGRYALYLSDATPVYEGNDISAMVKKLKNASPMPNGGSFYVAFEDFGPHRADNLVSSLRLQLDALDSSLTLEAIPDRVESWSGVMLQRVVDVIGEAEIRPLAGRAGWFEGNQEILQRVGERLSRAKLRVQASSRSAIVAFFDLFRNKVAKAKSARSLVEILSSTRAELKRSMHLSDAQFRALVSDQTGNTFTVELVTWRYLAG